MAAFIEKFGEVFIPKVIGVSDSDPFVDSEDTDYIMDAIREVSHGLHDHHRPRGEVHVGEEVRRLGGVLQPPQ